MSRTKSKKNDRVFWLISACSVLVVLSLLMSLIRNDPFSLLYDSSSEKQKPRQHGGVKLTKPMSGVHQHGFELGDRKITFKSSLLEYVYYSQITPDGERIVLIGRTGVEGGSYLVEVRNFSDGSILNSYRIPKRPRMVQISSNGKYMAIGNDGLRIYNTRSGRILLQSDSSHHHIKHFSFTEDERQLMVLDQNGRFSLFDIPSGHKKAQFSPKNDKIRVGEFELHPEKKKVFYLSNNTLKTISYGSQEVRNDINIAKISSFQISNNGKHVYVLRRPGQTLDNKRVGVKRAIQKINLKTNTRSNLFYITKEYDHLDIKQDTILLAGKDQLTVFDRSTKKKIHTESRDRAILVPKDPCSMSTPDGMHLLRGGRYSVRLVNLRNGQTRTVFGSHQEADDVEVAGFFPSGDDLFMIDQTGTVKRKRNGDRWWKTIYNIDDFNWLSRIKISGNGRFLCIRYRSTERTNNDYDDRYIVLDLSKEETKRVFDKFVDSTIEIRWSNDGGSYLESNWALNELKKLSREGRVVFSLNPGTVKDLSLHSATDVFCFLEKREGKKQTYSIMVHDFNNGKNEARKTFGKVEIERVQFSDKGSIITLLTEKKLIFWDWKEDEITTFQGFKHQPKQFKLLPEKDQLITLSNTPNESLKIWDIRKNKILKTFDEILNSIHSFQINSDTQRLLGISNTGLGFVWDLKTQAFLKRFNVFGREQLPLNSFLFSQNRRRLVFETVLNSNNVNDRIQHYILSLDNLQAGQNAEITKGHLPIFPLLRDNKYLSAMMAPENHRNYLMSVNNVNVKNGENMEYSKISVGRQNDDHKPYFVPTKNWSLLYGFCKEHLENHLWDLEEGKSYAPPVDVPMQVSKATLSADYERLALYGSDPWEAPTENPGTSTTRSQDKYVHLYDLGSRAFVKFKEFGPLESEVTAIEFSHDKQRLFTGHKNGILKAWNTQSGEEVWSKNGHSRKVESIACGPGGDFLLSRGPVISNDKKHRPRTDSVVVWKRKTRRKTATIQEKPEPDPYRMLEVGYFGGKYALIDDEHSDEKFSPLAFAIDDRLFIHGSGGFFIAPSQINGRLLQFHQFPEGSTLGTLKIFKDGEWIFYTPDGHFTGSNDIDKHVHWTVHLKNKLETIPIWSLNKEYYKPNLIQKTLNIKPESKKHSSN